MIKKGLLLSISICYLNLVFAQQASNDWQIHVGRELRVFTEKVKTQHTATNKWMDPLNGNYSIDNQKQQASFTVNNKLLNGAVTIFERNKKNWKAYTIVLSMVQSFEMYEDSLLLLKAHRDATKAYYKEYNKEGALTKEGWASLDKNKHFGKGITKSYYKSGTLAKTYNEVAGTNTEYYPNGNKKSTHATNLYETYNEDGMLNYKYYNKNKIQYEEYYENGKLTTRSYKDAAQNDVILYYKNGNQVKKGIYKTINGEQRLLLYNNAGKQIGNEKASVAEVKSPGN